MDATEIIIHIIHDVYYAVRLSRGVTPAARCHTPPIIIRCKVIES